MATERPQSADNHAMMVPGYHYVTGGLVLGYLVWAVWRALSLRDWESHFDLLGALALIGVYWYVRAFPLRAQDRLIRLEERLRLERVLPAAMVARIPELSTRQLIALRFAPDAELPELVEWVLREPVTDAKAIKQRIRSWRADHARL
ncbi:MAG: DUF6526 family protein [Gemmatimonadaceae bacterium]|jgi:hypothetical protein|nr:DUF6526 family protein [Gemmatimonadaceae bacterium]